MKPGTWLLTLIMSLLAPGAWAWAAAAVIPVQQQEAPADAWTGLQQQALHEWSLGRYQQAAARLDAMVLQGTGARQAAALLQRLELALQTGEPGHPWAQAAEAAIVQLDPEAGRLALALQLEERYLEQGQLAQAQRWWKQLSDWPATRADALQYQATAAELRAREGKVMEAIQLLRPVLFRAQAEQQLDDAWLWHARLAEYLQQLGDRDGAIRAGLRASALLQPVRDRVQAELFAHNRSYRDALAPLYLSLADLLLQRAATNAATSQDDLRAAQAAIEALRTVELEDYFRDACRRTTARNEALPDLPPQTAVLYPVLLSQRTVLIVQIGQRLEQVELDVSARQRQDDVLQLRRLLGKRTTAQYLIPARRIFDWLLRPLESRFAAAGINTLVVVPDGVLRTIPLAALHDGKQFVVERYALAVVPALSLVRGAPPGPSDVNLAAGLSEARDGFAALPDVEVELSAVQQQLHATLMRNAAFTVTAFRSALEQTPWTVVHIASHGELEADGRHSFILAADGRLTFDQLEASLSRGRPAGQPLDLLTLSACRTAAGSERAALGLGGMAVKAGAQTALASLWYVNDEATSELMTRFYRWRATGMGKARALQLAQRDLLDIPRFRHPALWSPFLLIGAWQ